MWSLYNKKEAGGFEDDCDGGDSAEGEKGIFDYVKDKGEIKGEMLKPLKFSNNKTQEDVVREIIDAIGDMIKM